jgi:hypothetical protein
MNFALNIVMMLAMAATLVGIWRIPAPRAPLFRLLGLLTALALAAEVFGTITAAKQINNTVVYNLYFCAEVLLVPAMVYTQRPGWRGWLLAAVALILVTLVWNVAQVGFNTTLPTTVMMTGALVFAAILMVLLWHLANTSSAPLQRTPAFWVFIGMLVYFGGLLPVVGSVPVIYGHDKQLAGLLWRTLPFLALVRYLLAAYGCWLQARIDAQRT